MFFRYEYDTQVFQGDPKLIVALNQAATRGWDPWQMQHVPMQVGGAPHIQTPDGQAAGATILNVWIVNFRRTRLPWRTWWEILQRTRAMRKAEKFNDAADTAAKEGKLHVVEGEQRSH